MFKFSSFVSLLLGFNLSCSYSYQNIFNKFHVQLPNTLRAHTNCNNEHEASTVRQRVISKTSRFLQSFPLVIASISALSSKKSFADDGEESFINSLAIMLEARDVIQPTNVYVDYQAYDNARTNAQYILNQLQFQKNVKNLIQRSIDYCEDMDAIENAQEAGNKITNTLIQYDSSIYTCIFIPSDDGSVPPSAVKYRNEAATYYKSFNNDIAVLLKLANANQLNAAQAKATQAVKDMPVVLFKKVQPKRTGSQNN